MAYEATSAFAISRSSVSSTSPLVSSTKPKDYEAGFAQLSSHYGFAGGVPCAPSTSNPSTQKTNSKQSAKSSNVPETQARSESRWGSAFGKLSSQYGFGGHLPSLPEKKKTQKKDGK